VALVDFCSPERGGAEKIHVHLALRHFLSESCLFSERAARLAASRRLAASATPRCSKRLAAAQPLSSRRRKSGTACDGQRQGRV